MAGSVPRARQMSWCGWQEAVLGEVIPLLLQAAAVRSMCGPWPGSGAGLKERRRQLRRVAAQPMFSSGLILQSRRCQAAEPVLLLLRADGQMGFAVFAFDLGRPKLRSVLAGHCGRRAGWGRQGQGAVPWSGRGHGGAAACCSEARHCRAPEQAARSDGVWSDLPSCARSTTLPAAVRRCRQSTTASSTIRSCRSSVLSIRDRDCAQSIAEPQSGDSGVV